MEDLQLLDYILIFKRQRKLAASIFIVCALLFGSIALTWSNYRATATVEVAQPDIPDSMTAPVGTNAQDLLQSIADLRISRLQQKVLSTGSLVEIITKFNLYAKNRQNTPIADVADKMLKKIKIELVSSLLANPASAQKASADQLSAIAFTLSFDYNDPLLAQQVTNELVSRFLDEDIKERKRQAKETSAFLSSQIKLLETSLEEQEQQIADFRAKHGDVRPEALAYNQQAVANLTMSLQNVESQITTNVGAQGALRAQLAATDPYSRVLAEGQILTTPTIQLKTLQTDYATLTAKYGPNHPDVLKTKRQIEALQIQLGAPGAATALEAKIADTRARLATAERTYGPDNPDVLSLQKQLSGLESQLSAELAKGPKSRTAKADPDNPVYLQIEAQLKTSEEQNKALLKQKEQTQTELDKYQRAVVANPAVEQELAKLTRDYDNAQLRYRDLRAKKMAADMSATVEEDRSGQRLIVIDPPDLPTKTRPSHLILFIGSLFMAGCLSVAGVIGKQILLSSVVSPSHLEAIAGVPPLMTIPYISSRDEETGVLTSKNKRIVLAVAIAVVALFLFSIFVMPFDVFMAVLSRAIGLS